jgi:hypothetical protein
MKFSDAVKQWKAAESVFREAKLSYETKFNTTLLHSQAASAERRKAEAELATTQERRALDKAEIEAFGAKAVMEHMQATGAAA